MSEKLRDVLKLTSWIFCGAVVGAIIILILGFTIASFVNLDINPINWSIDARSIIGGFSVAGSLTGAIMAGLICTEY